MPVRRQTPADRKAALDRIVEAIVWLQTEGRRLARERAADHGLTPTQLSVVKLLETVGDLSLSALSERIRANNSTVTGIVDRMERDGLVRRERDARDRRVWMIRLTDRGRRVAQKVADTPWETLKRAIASLAADDQDRLLQIMEKVAASISKEAQNGFGR